MYGVSKKISYSWVYSCSLVHFNCKSRVPRNKTPRFTDEKAISKVDNLTIDSLHEFH